MKKTLFQQKIDYLYDSLDIGEDSFTELFMKEGQKKSDRKKTVIKKWREEEMKGNPTVFAFDEYKISKDFKIGSEPAFTKASFLSDSLESFKERVDNYIDYKEKPIELLEYKYIYYYYKKKKKIVYATLNTLRKINNNKYEVELVPPSSKINIESYKGILEINNERYYISVRNNIEILTLYFVLGRGYADNSKVYGIGLGISHQKGLVEATKELLTKRELTKEEEDELYLSLNESEYLLADEIEHTESIKKEYLKKINKKLNNLTTFVNTSKESLTLKDDVNIDPYLNIFFRNLIDTNEISKKVILEQNYFTARRRSALKSFFNTISNREKSSSVKMVYPIFKEEAVLFDSEDEISVKLLNKISSLAKKGLDLTIIFIINKDFINNNNFNKEVKKLIISGVKIKITPFESIKKSKISSYDLLYCKGEETVAIYTNRRDRLRLYKVTTIKDRIKTLTDDFKKIEEKSFEFDEFLENKSLTNDKTLKQLIGTWHWYFYSSIETDKQVEIWDFIVNIKPNKKVYFYNEKYNDLTLEGFIDTTFTKNQSFIKAYTKKSKNLSLIFIENRDIDRYVFKVALLDKQRGVHRNMSSFTIFSRVKLSDSEIIEALGADVSRTRFMEEDGFDKRINDLDMRVRRKSDDKS